MIQFERTGAAAMVLGVAICCQAAAVCSAGEASGPGDVIRLTTQQRLRGGLVVHLGCEDPGRLTALSAGGNCIVHGLDTDADRVAEARTRLQSAGAYGRISASQFDGRHLPYRDNLVNLLVAPDQSDVSRDEMMRVLAPRGAAYVKSEGRWTKTVKPWPAEIDQWTHFLHGPDNNAVAKDRKVGPPSCLQWIAGPIHLRSHEHLNSVSALVSASGRIFYIIDEGPTALVAAPPRWRLVARDAFNGILLWKRDIEPWEGHFRLFRSGPPAIARRLVAVGDRVYVTLGYGKPVTALDAATGRTVETYEATRGGLEILCWRDKLFVVTGRIDTKRPADSGRRYYPAPAPRDKGIVAVDAASAHVLWKRRDQDTAELMPTTLATAGGKVFFQNTRQVICLDAASGREQWRRDRPVYTKRLSWSAPTLVVQDGVVLSADGSTGGIRGNVPRGGDRVQWILSDTDIRRHPEGDLVAFSADDGRKLWNGRSLQGFCNPGDLFVIGGKVWCGADVSTQQARLNLAVDLKTGKVDAARPDNGMPVGGHTRCFRNKATERFLVLGDVGVELVDVNDWSWNANPWVRGTCQYGVMPCNGLLYVPSDSCACRPNMRLHGFSAMASRPSGERVGTGPQGKPSRFASQEQPPGFGRSAAPLRGGSQEPDASGSGALTRGPAYGAAGGHGESTGDRRSGQWPTYRGDAQRSGWTRTAVPAKLKARWQTGIGGKLSSLTVAEGRVFVARTDAHAVYAMDADTGTIAWSRTVGGPVDSPPTIFNSLVIFGCHDGCVYALRSGDGQLVWRFRAAPEDRLLVAMESLESAWPVSGSVLVHDGKVWFAAGRSPYLDGGILLFALDAASGRVLVKRTVFSRGPQRFHTAAPTGEDNAPPGLPDILSAYGDTIYMRWLGFDSNGKTAAVAPHLFSATGFLDDTWWHRTYWQYGTWMRGGFGGWPQAARRVPAGRIMVASDNRLFSYARTRYDSGNGGNVSAGHIGVVKQDYQDMGRVDFAQNPYRLYAMARPDAKARRRGKRPESIQWQTAVPLLVRAMVLADETLFIAGPEAGVHNRGLVELATAQPGSLWAVAAADGHVLARYPLAADPAFDALAAAGHCLYLATRDGNVLCFGGADL